MAKSGRKRVVGVLREPNGRAQREDRPTRAQVIRAVSAYPEYGSQAGLAFLAREITEAEYKQAKSVCEIVRNYRQALLISGVASPSAESGRGVTKADPDSPAGQAEAKWHARAVARYDRMRETLSARGAAVCSATIAFCTDEPCDWQRRMWARVGLAQLVDGDRAGGGRRGPSATQGRVLTSAHVRV